MKHGHDVVHAADIRPGSPDAFWLKQCKAESRLLLTTDKDFGELVFRDRLNSHGVILFRMERLTLGDRLERLEQAWPIVEESAQGRFVVVTANKVRIREMKREAQG